MIDHANRGKIRGKKGIREGSRVGQTRPFFVWAHVKCSICMGWWPETVESRAQQELSKRAHDHDGLTTMTTMGSIIIEGLRRAHDHDHDGLDHN